MSDEALQPSGHRASARSVRAMVTSPHAQATAAGVRILEQGGNAADAGVAIAAALSVLYPHMTGIGGDAFFLYYDARSATVAGYNGSGPSAALATQEYYAKLGARSIPFRGGLSALTVPGAVDAWCALHERFGTLAFSQLLEPAIAHARAAPIARSFARGLNEEHALLASDEGARSLYAGAPRYAVGERFAQPALSRTLERIGQNGRAFWYEGEAAAHIEATCRRAGSPLRAADLGSYKGFFTEPLRSQFARFTSLVTPPNSQGLVLPLAQNIYASIPDHAGLPLGSAALAHAEIEAIKFAFLDRDEWVGDPRALQAPLSQLLSPAHARVRLAAFDPNRVSADPGNTKKRGAAGDTTYFACVDADGNALSMIQSLYFHFGSCVGVPELGIVLQNRGCSFTLDEGRPTSLAPNRLPFHTLMAAMLLEDEQPALVYGTMGGEGQPQTCLQISIAIAERGVDPQAALDAPRWRYGKTWGEEVPGVSIESRTHPAVIAGLRARGHKVTVVDDYEESMGHAGAIRIDRAHGVLVGASDPRSDGAALGL